MGRPRSEATKAKILTEQEVAAQKTGEIRRTIALVNQDMVNQKKAEAAAKEAAKVHAHIAWLRLLEEIKPLTTTMELALNREIVRVRKEKGYPLERLRELEKAADEAKLFRSGEARTMPKPKCKEIIFRLAHFAVAFHKRHLAYGLENPEAKAVRNGLRALRQAFEYYFRVVENEDCQHEIKISSHPNGYPWTCVLCRVESSPSLRGTDDPSTPYLLFLPGRPRFVTT